MTQTTNDKKCLICNGAVEIQHTPARDTLTGTICHDYCHRMETPEARRKRASLLVKCCWKWSVPLRWA